MKEVSPLHFSKYSGCGNDFILIDDQEKTFPTHEETTIMRLCHRNNGIGADGLILLQKSLKASFRMRIFNSNGYETEMCGNGFRCLMKFIADLGFSTQSNYSIETQYKILHAGFEGDQVRVEMGEFSLCKDPISIDWKGDNLTVHSMNTGVPHAVIFMNDISTCHLQELGPYLRYSDYYGESGTNVNIAQIIGPNEITMRTYERGVEAETLACGTGATAVALIAAQLHNFYSPVTIQFRSQEKLLIHFQKMDSIFSKTTMTGPAHYIFRGQVQI
jgi:diaminopimelate epimerase